MTLETLEENIACITLNRPERLNAIDGSLIDGVDAALDVLSDGQHRVAIITGAGQAWTQPAGPDTPSFKINYDAQVRLANLYTRIYELDIPVIAAVNGVAVGGGLAFTLVSDIRVASDQARFGSVFIKAGFSSMDMGTSYLLPKIVGAGVARELMLTGRIIEADEAYRIKLVHEVVASDDLMPATLKLARSIAENNAYGVWQTKIGLNAALDAPSLRHAIEIENRTQILSGFTNNPVEAAKAHMEKRAPNWDPL
ncbi:putative enoyl-CoA hydratase/isomerase [Mycobacterium montefiorense]|uniref:Enoyl-CoA hydratase/isomerase n=1 Tax=Mycobacterium montefiorense TaxID=154654 RepID=A0AA37PKL3_9MYCO|nr:enoyl-CoA hydratase/isomerase family protein [Mycobacterium montefiorense]GBG39977.1 putative enoyl-CoA hydratase/isomerase [Mycobacterium montefiorense]GKU33664.1 putative enoyl-CoA hydratase/isomerase [Mycobacterium montefiorense]GKU39600.1 putative enoyl-CoA hydratase/isomerase [Mycobacterium montefiorense]GKU43877.1 putative enoyl-CoA hydratase/isomerase [Mycobacterium montefiorense]GKU52631.1 putative enoyl-CoA hydratase/isomerase [Mycobacterium montefiorense]